MQAKTKKSSKSIPKTGWQKVKVKGNVISDEGFGLEGLIGLEVLEDYDSKLVLKDKKKRPRREKLSIQERKEKKEKREKKRKAKVAEEDSGVTSGDDAASDTETPAKKKKKQKKAKNKKGKEEASEETNSTPGKFVLLKSSEDDNETEQSIRDEMHAWNGLGVPMPILQALAEKGFKTPTEIQSLTLAPAILGKRDILGAAETGSGKTLAFGIPILAGIMELKKRNLKGGIRKAPKTASVKLTRDDRDNLTPPPEELQAPPQQEQSDLENSESEEEEGSDKPLYAVILTPTRELAVQVRDHMIAAAKYTGIQVVAIFGGLAAVKQERILKKCPEIVVATPGRFWELINQQNSHLNKIDDVSFLVIDETDRMVEKGHFEELRLLLNRLNSDENRKLRRQNFVFSATLSMVHDLPDHLQKLNVGRKRKLVKPTPGLKIQSLIEELGISQPKVVDITRSSQTAQTLTESRLICSMEHKDYYLYYFLQRHPGRTIVFCNSIDCVKRLSTLFGLLECSPLALHANMMQKQRLKNLERFTSNPNGLLIATDVAARGLDIPNVQHVIHYQVPRTSENYVHRSGRTARANQDGITVMFMDPGEVKTYLKLCKTLDRTEDLPLFPVSERHLNVVKERVDLAREVDKLELRVKRTQSEIGWMKKNAEEMEMIIDGYDDEDNDSDDDAFQVERHRNSQLLANRRQQLAQALNKQLFPRGYSMKYPTSTGQLVIPQMEAGTVGDNSAVKAVQDSVEEIKASKKLRNKKKK